MHWSPVCVGYQSRDQACVIAFSEEEDSESGFVKLELSDIAGGGIWKVTAESGMVTWFGQSLSDRIYLPDSPQKTYAWKFSYAEDLNGNFMTAVYDDSDFQTTHLTYLREIRYTGNSATGLAANQYVRFSYKSRPDSYVSKTAGFLMRMDRLLDRVTIGWDDPAGSNNINLWDYKMVYEISRDSHRPLLKTVESSRRSTRPEFSYQRGSHSLIWR